MFLDDFNTEVTDFPISITYISVSALLSHTGRSQELFENMIGDEKSNIVAIEIIWDTDITMEKVIKVMKCIPGNIQIKGYMEISSLIACSGSYYSSNTKIQDNWRNNEKFANKEPISWVKIAWMMLSGLKYPNLIIFQRVQGYKSSPIVITSLDFDNLLRFAKKQDEKSSIKQRNSKNPKISESDSNEVQSNHSQQYRYLRPQLESKELPARSESKYSHPLEMAKLHSLEKSLSVDLSNKSQISVHDKYDKQQTKSGSFNNRFDLLSKKSEDPHSPLITDEIYNGSLEENSHKVLPSHIREDSFRGLSRNEEMERIYLGCSKEKEYSPIIPSSRQDEVITKGSFIPQKNLITRLGETAYYSPADSDGNYQYSSPHFKEKYNHQDKYLDMEENSRWNKEIDHKDELKDFYYKRNEDIKHSKEILNTGNRIYWDREEIENNRSVYAEDLKRKDQDLIKEDSYCEDSRYKGYEDSVYQEPNEISYTEYSKKQQLPLRGQKQGYDNLEKNEKISIENKDDYYENEEDLLIELENNFEKERERLNSKEVQKDRRVLDNERNKNSKLLEEYYHRTKSRKREEKEIDDSYESLRIKQRESFDNEEDNNAKLRELKNDIKHQKKELKNLENFQGLIASNEIKGKNYKIDSDEEFKSVYYNNHSRNTEKNDLKPRDLNLNERQKELKYQDESDRIQHFKSREDRQVDLAPSEILISRKYNSLASKDAYDKYNPANYQSQEELSDIDIHSQSFQVTEDYSNGKNYSKNKRQEYLSKYRNLTPIEGRNAAERFRGDQIRERYSNKEEKKNNEVKNYRENEINYRDLPKRVNKNSGFEKNLESISEENAENPKVNELNYWNCEKCNKKIVESSYECTICRLISWDQFYKVKSLLNNKNTNENEKTRENITKQNTRNDSKRRMHSGNNTEEENNDWICKNCKISNKYLFFLCKSCRKPKTHINDSASAKNIRKECKSIS